MAVLSVEEMLDGRSCSEGTDRTYNRKFIVVTDGESWSQEVKNAVKLKYGIVYGGPYILPTEIDLNALVTGINADQDYEGGNRWKVTVDWSTKSKDGQDPAEKEKDPTQRAASYEFDPVPYNRVVEVDLDGKPVVNSAGQYFDPPIEVPDAYVQMTITRFENDFSIDTIDKYTNTINSVKFFGRKERCVWCTGVRSRDTWEEGRRYYQSSYIFLISKTPWDPRDILDQGRYVKPEKNRDGSTASAQDQLKVVAALGADGEPTMDPILLNGQGKPQTEVLDVPNTNPLRKVPKPVYLPFRFKGREDFNKLRF